MPKGISLFTVFMRQAILGFSFSYLTTSLKTAGNAPMPFGIDLI